MRQRRGGQWVRCTDQRRYGDLPIQDSTAVPGITLGPTPIPAFNVIIGTDGADRITGLDGDGFDTIRDFQPGIDHLIFKGLAASAVTTKAAIYSKTAGLDVVYGSGGDHVVLEKITALAAGDLAFA